MPEPLLSTPRAPYDRFTARHAGAGGSAGGPADPPGIGRAITPGLVDGRIREGDGANTWDRLVQHERMPWYHLPYAVGQADTLTDWTMSGPIRPSLNMRQATVRKLVGTDATRNYDPHPKPREAGTADQGHGMHTNPTLSARLTQARYRNTVQQQPARINRLAAARYAGQSYSQTTRVQGG
jgi:hypothetical protein